MNKTTIIVVFVIMLIVLIILFLTREDLFKNLTNESDFGIYSEPVISECYTPNGLCSEIGTQTTTKTCIPNPKTGYGCLDENGNQTYATLITKTSCTSICRSQIWKYSATSTCVYLPEDENLPCVDVNTLGTQYYTQTCVPNDSTGPNTCTLNINPYNGETPPDGCVLDTTDGTIAICNIGVEVTVVETCTVIEDSKPICGIWTSSNPETTTTHCVNSVFSFPTSDCYGIEGIKYSLDSDFLRPGYNTAPMQCTQWINTEDGTVSVENSTATCLPYSGCFSNPTEIVDSIKGGNTETVQCYDFNNAAVPGCVKACVYVPPNYESVYPWAPEFNVLFGAVFYVQKGNDIITIQYTPCPVDPTQAYVNANYFIKENFGDCMAYPNVALTNGVPITAMNLVDAQNNYAAYNLISTCSPAIIGTTASLLWLFKPRIEQPDSSRFRCAVFMVSGKNAAGYLTYTNGILSWTQAQTSIFSPFGITELQAQTFVVTYNNGTYSLYYEEGNNLISLNVPIMYPNRTSGVMTLDSLSFISPLYNGEPLNSIPDINVRYEALSQILNERYTRLDPNTCNPYYGNTLPPGYPIPDV